MQEGWLHSHGWHLKCQRDISVAGGIRLRSVGSQLQARLPSLQNQSAESTQITFSYEKRQGFSLPEMDVWSSREAKEQHINCSHAASYPGLW